MFASNADTPPLLTSVGVLTVASGTALWNPCQKQVTSYKLQVIN